jgi:hypothetical protein
MASVLFPQFILQADGNKLWDRATADLFIAVEPVSLAFTMSKHPWKLLCLYMSVFLGCIILLFGIYGAQPFYLDFSASQFRVENDATTINIDKWNAASSISAQRTQNDCN